MNDKFDFSGWATRNNIKCSDGRRIIKDAFKDCDGATVPLVWNHQHNDSFNVLGHAVLKNESDGVYTYCYFNDTEQGRNSKMLLEHGDISALSIYANHLKQRGSDVVHGIIREVSLVLAGCNPGAYIDNIAFAHGDDDNTEGEAIIYTGYPLSLCHGEMDDIELEHSDEKDDDHEKEREEKKSEDEETVSDIFDSMTEKQRNAAYTMVALALGEEDESNDKKENSEEGDDTMKHNVFENEEQKTDVLSHSDQEGIIKLAKTSAVGSFQTACQIYADENQLQHDAISGGFTQTGDGNVTTLFPEYKDVRPGAPELITNDQGWISVVMNKVHKSPISRIRTRHVDIRNIDALRAKGYRKGKQKKQAGNFELVRRTVDPQTVYVKNALHRDDIVDITDFDYVQYLYNIDRMMLNEELATAIMLGDGRDVSAEDKISPDHIKPIWLDDELYTIHVDLDAEKARTELQGTNTAGYFGENYIYAEAMINTLLYAREKFKGSGTPDLFITPHMLNVMLLARDMNGRRIYSSKAELASSLNVGEIYTAEQFEGKTRNTSDNKEKKLLAIVANLNDYTLGATKGGEVTHFTQFDIDFNQEKSLLETRVSGALTRVYSAIAIEENVASDSGSSADNNETP